MLYLDTCTVEAGADLYDSTLSGSFYCSADTTWIHYDYSPNGSYGGPISPNYSYISGGDHFEVPFKIRAPISNFPNVTKDLNGYYMMMLGNITFSISGGTVSNVCLKNANGDLMWSSGDYWGTKQYFLGYNALNPDQNAYVFTGYLSFDFVFNKGKNGSDGNSNTSGSWSLSTRLYVGNTTVEEYSSSAQVVKDPVLNENIEALQEDTATTASNTTGILSKITEFFGSFFSNLIGVFVPEDGYFSGWFDRVNTLLSEKLGMLYAPFDLVISTLQAIYSSDSTESGIPFPGIKWEDTWLVEPFTFTFASLGDSFDDLRDKVYFATDTVLVLTFLMLLQSKVRLILEGHE